MKSLILGGGGFIGTALVKRMLGLKMHVRVMDTKKIPFQLRGVSGLDWIEGDFVETSVDHWSKYLEGIDVVFHLVSTTIPHTSELDPAHDVSTNIVPTINLLNALIDSQVQKLIFVSSGGTVYGRSSGLISEDHPTDPVVSYGATKLAIEKYIKVISEKGSFHPVILRVSNPYGADQDLSKLQGAVGHFLQKALRDEIIEIWGDGSVTRDYLFMNDLVGALLAAQKYVGEEKVFNVGTGKGTSLSGLISLIEKVLKRNVKVVYKPYRDFDVEMNILDCSKAKSLLGWSYEFDLEEGLNFLIENQTVFGKNHL